MRPPRIPVPVRLAPVLAAIVAACTGDASVAPSRPQAAPAASLAQSAAAFAFLPPLGAGPAPAGTFDAGATPVVQVCRLVGAHCAGIVATFTRTSGGIYALRADEGAGEYAATWHTQRFALNPGVFYRVRVMLGGRELGHADVDVLARAGESPRAGFVGVVVNQPLDIRFFLGTANGGGGPAIPGDPTALASPSLPRQRFEAREEDYSNDHPELPGIFLSFNTLLLAFEPTVTLGDANALLASVNGAVVGSIPGTASVPGILFVRLPTTTHAQMEAALAALRGDARVRFAVQDALLETQVVTRPNAGTPADWTWDASPAGGNWGLEISRVPQMWNLNAGVRKANLGSPVTAVYDVGFVAGHPDLAIETNLTPARVHDHGTHVAGTIGATHDNGLGVDGVNPFARLAVHGPPSSASAAGPYATRLSIGADFISDLHDLMRSRPDIRVVSASVGYNWARAGIGADTDPGVPGIVNAQGGLFALMLELRALEGPLPVVVVAAGNDSNDGFGVQSALYTSPMTNAALRLGVASIVVVEAVAFAMGGAGDATRSDFSQTGGHISGPGTDVLSTIAAGTGYGLKSGTSMATPHVSGLLGWLYALEPSLPSPTLAQNEVREMLMQNAIGVAGGAAPRMDAYASALDVDRLTGGTRVLRMLVDLDDGTPDGNLRAVASGAPVLGEDADGDGGPGDGAVDMSDFRRWRDWYLQVADADDLSLDGAADHPKKDVNGDGTVGTPTGDEIVYPRLDLNGDGKAGLNDRAFVPGRIARSVTDLEVLQELFVDLHYAKTDLPGLVESGDLHLDATSCLAANGAASVRSTVRVVGGGATIQTRTHSPSPAARAFVVTVPTSSVGYTMRLEALDASGDVVASEEKDIAPLRSGSDHHWSPACQSGVAVAIDPVAVTVAAGGTQQFTAQVVGAGDASLVWTTTQPGGTVGGEGLFTAGTAVGTFEVRATSVADPTRSATAVVTIVTPAVSVTQVIALLRVESTLAGRTPCRNEFSLLGGPVPTAIDRTLHCESVPDSPDDPPGSATADGRMRYALTYANGALSQIDITVTESVSASEASGAATNVFLTMVIGVTGGEYAYELTGTALVNATSTRENGNGGGGISFIGGPAPQLAHGQYIGRPVGVSDGNGQLVAPNSFSPSWTGVMRPGEFRLPIALSLFASTNPTTPDGASGTYQLRLRITPR